MRSKEEIVQACLIGAVRFLYFIQGCSGVDVRISSGVPEIQWIAGRATQGSQKWKKYARGVGDKGFNMRLPQFFELF